MRTVTVILLSLASFAATASGSDFKKIAWIDPYGYIMDLYRNGAISDTSEYHPDSYFGLMDSMGINLSLTTVDQLSTNNAFDIGVIGVTTFREFSGLTLNQLVHYSNIAHAFAGNTDEAEGYWWSQSNGANGPYSGVPNAFVCDPNNYSADTVLISHGWKFAWKWPVSTKERTSGTSISG